MSAISLFEYPVMDENLLHKLGFTLDETKFSFKDETGSHPLAAFSEDGATVKSSVISVRDQRGGWDLNKTWLNIEIGGEILNPQFLFGEHGLAAKNKSVLGLAVIWTDQKARIRGVEKIGLIPSEIIGPYKYRKLLSFEPGLLRGILTLRLELYLEQSGLNDQTGENCFSNRQGTLLGQLDEIRVALEGNGSIFPIAEVEESGGPLWWIETFLEDIETDEFDEDHFVLYLNKANPSFPLLKLSEPEEDSPLLKEVIASALFNLIVQILGLEKGKEMLKDKDHGTPGTVQHSIKYMIDTYGWGKYIDDLEKLNKAIHETVEKKF